MFSSKHGTVRHYLAFSLELFYPNYVFSFSFKLGTFLCVDRLHAFYFVKGLKMMTYDMSCSLALH